MSQRRIQRIAAAGALTALLAGPVHAEGWEPGAWRWLTEIWKGSASILWSGSDADRQVITKQGLGIDPDGQPHPAGPACTAGCEQGWGIDPDG